MNSHCPACAKPVTEADPVSGMRYHAACEERWSEMWECIKQDPGDDEPQRPAGTNLKTWLFPEIHETWEPKRVGGRQ
jgi:hypothetical protein